MFQYLIVILNVNSYVVGMDITRLNSCGAEVLINKRENLIFYVKIMLYKSHVFYLTISSNLMLNLVKEVTKVSYILANSFIQVIYTMCAVSYDLLKKMIKVICINIGTIQTVVVFISQILQQTYLKNIVETGTLDILL